MSVSTTEINARSLRLLRQFVGFVQIGAGLGILYNGAEAFTLPQFQVHAALLPWWWWGSASLIIGVLIYLSGRLRLLGLLSGAVWWALWSSLLIIGILLVGQPIASVFTYLLIIFLHLLLAGREWQNRTEP